MAKCYSAHTTNHLLANLWQIYANYLSATLYRQQFPKGRPSAVQWRAIK